VSQSRSISQADHKALILQTQFGLASEDKHGSVQVTGCSKQQLEDMRFTDVLSRLSATDKDSLKLAVAQMLRLLIGTEYKEADTFATWRTKITKIFSSPGRRS
jgi:hypothetical protein